MQRVRVSGSTLPYGRRLQGPTREPLLEPRVTRVDGDRAAGRAWNETRVLGGPHRPWTVLPRSLHRDGGRRRKRGHPDVVHRRSPTGNGCMLRFVGGRDDRDRDRRNDRCRQRRSEESERPRARRRGHGVSRRHTPKRTEVANDTTRPPGHRTDATKPSERARGPRHGRRRQETGTSTISYASMTSPTCTLS